MISNCADSVEIGGGRGGLDSVEIGADIIPLQDSGEIMIQRVIQERDEYAAIVEQVKTRLLTLFLKEE